MEKISGDDHDHDYDHDKEDNTMIRSPLSDGKMLIKLKIPKLAAPAPATMEAGRSPENVIGSSSSSKAVTEGKRVCQECKKEFSSGKALGGHMRVHVQAANRNTFLKPSKTTKFKKANNQFNNGDGNLKKEHKPYYESCVNGEGKPTCSLCGKSFPSLKSLFGHMRCHPERLWRGIIPPPNNAAAGGSGNKPSSSPSSSSSLGLSMNEESSSVVNGDGDQMVDLTKFVRGWSVTERRGRRSLKVADDDEVLREAVEDLMSLAHGDPSMAESDVTQKPLRVEVFEGTNSNSVTNKDKIDEKGSSAMGLMANNGKGKEVMEEETPPAKMEFAVKNFSDSESDSRNTNEQLLINCKYNHSPYKSPNKIKKRKKMKLMMELEQGLPETMGIVTGASIIPPPPLLLPMPSPLENPATTESKYKCTTCNKSFASHQALGGHRSSHNKFKITSTDRHHAEEDDYNSLVLNQTGVKMEKETEFAGDAMASESANYNSIHQCKICDKIFPTGQALGGHKRCHWTGTTETQAPSSQVTSTGEEASQTDGGRKVLDFDLNEVPTTTMEDEAGNVNGYASSSYNSNMG